MKYIKNSSEKNDRQIIKKYTLFLDWSAKNFEDINYLKLRIYRFITI